MENKKTSKLAVCAIVSALSATVMLVGGLTPLSAFSAPILSGALFVVLIIEYGRKWAMLSYACVAVLSYFTVINREAALIFAAFFGYYPILKSTLESIRMKPMKHPAAETARYQPQVTGITQQSCEELNPKRLKNVRNTTIRIIVILIKYIWFNFVFIAFYSLAYFVLRLSYVINQFESFGVPLLLILLVAANVFFFLYDLLITRFTALYVYKLRHRFFDNR
ncbi:MAG: hypothetical protein FWG69_01630 [Oscillospiraceae bacterium]|nr:hypothetical protein [Oscillospiraceae bacterium]